MGWSRAGCSQPGSDDARSIERGLQAGRAGCEPHASDRRLVRRSALLRRLSAAGSGKVILICAPAGSGKTVLVRSWAEALFDRVAWVQVERGG